MDDLISRQALKQTLGIDSDDCDKCAWGYHGLCKRGSDFEDACIAIEDAASAESEIIYCKDCKRHNVGIGDYREENGKRHWYWKDEACPLVGYRGKAQGHEYDYQFCVYAERRTDE